MLVIFRNPKDTVVSFYHFSNKNPVLPSAESWDSFYSDFMSGEGDHKTRLAPKTVKMTYINFNPLCLHFGCDGRKTTNIKYIFVRVFQLCIVMHRKYKVPSVFFMTKQLF